MIAVSTRRRASEVTTVGQLMQVCGESVEQGGASDPPCLWEVSNAAVAEKGEPVEVQLGPSPPWLALSPEEFHHVLNQRQTG